MTFISLFFSPILPKDGKQDFIYISLYNVHVVPPILKNNLWEFIEHKVCITLPYITCTNICILLSNIINQEQYIISLMFVQLHMCNLEELLFN